MAHFADPFSGNPIKQVFVPLGQAVEIGVWGPLYGERFEKEVIVEPDSDAAKFLTVTKTMMGGKEKAITSNIRSWSVFGNKSGGGMLLVKTQEGQLFASPIKVHIMDMVFAWGRKVSAAFKFKVFEICTRLGMNPSDLMACMHRETGGTFSPSIENRNEKGVVEAVGLIQFTEQAVPIVGKSLGQLSQMSALEQLDYVERYFARFRGRIKSVEDVYCVMAAPAALGQPHTFVLWSEADPGTSSVYRRNKNLDADGDGKITKGDIGRRGRESLVEGLKPGNVG